MPTLALLVAYNGASFSGFARQRILKDKPAVLTVQGEIEHALALLFRRKVETVCAGRTDAGVHALGQTVSFEISPEEYEERSIDSLLRSLNALTPEEISIRSVRLERDGFSARFDAKWREYRYRIYCSDTPPIFSSDYVWWIRSSLDVAAMSQASSCLIGEHDFKSFCVTASAVNKPTCRNVREIEIFEEEHLGEHCLCIRVVGNAFLHSMIRVMVGTLVEVGLGRRDPEWVKQALAACSRAAAGPTAPAKGLTFWHVEYQDAR